MAKLYSVIKDGQTVRTEIPGQYAGWRDGKIFGRLDCKSGMRMKKESRVFFAALEDAVKQGYRPYNKCKSLSQKDFELIKGLVREGTLEDFYHRGLRRT